jgi:hypothetical protein
MPISPDMLSPETVPVKASVSGIGLVMEIFQARSSPFAVPSKISPELPSTPCARQRAAGILQGQRRLALAHWRRHDDIPVSVQPFLVSPLFPSEPEWS